MRLRSPGLGPSFSILVTHLLQSRNLIFYSCRFLPIGGPGSSGLVVLGAFTQYLVNMTGGHYDVISWDPRGVGFSS